MPQGDWTWTYGTPSDMGLPEPAPRALVALSEDRQWLVVFDRLGFWIMERVLGPDVFGYLESDWRDDTGQDANEVLREWLERAS